jgi:hypothetical protein
MRQRSFAPTVLAAVLLLAAAAPPASAQRGADRRAVQLYVDLGYVNLFSYPKWFAIGPELEIRLGRLFSLNPGATVWIGQSPAQKVRVVPELTANVRLGRIMLGGGAVYRISAWPVSATEEFDGTTDRGWLMPKAQASYALGPTRLTFFLVFPGGRSDVAAGLTLGMGLGRRSRNQE